MLRPGGDADQREKRAPRARYARKLAAPPLRRLRDAGEVRAFLSSGGMRVTAAKAAASAAAGDDASADDGAAGEAAEEEDDDGEERTAVVGFFRDPGGIEEDECVERSFFSFSSFSSFSSFPSLSLLSSLRRSLHSLLPQLLLYCIDFQSASTNAT